MGGRIVACVLATASLLSAGSALAQVEASRSPNYAVAFGMGLDKVEDQGVLFLSGSFRFNFWEKREGQRRDGVERALAWRGRSRMKGFLEAEMGYWKDSELSPVEGDLLLGVNAIAVLPTESADLFFGGGIGVHFLDLVAETSEASAREKKVGGNLQFGVDLNFTHRTSFFALGRFDILEGDVHSFQSKVQIGGRHRF